MRRPAVLSEVLWAGDVEAEKVDCWALRYNRSLVELS